MIIDVTRISVSPFPVESVVEMEIRQSLNEHAELYLKGIIPKEGRDASVLSADDSTQVTVSDLNGVLFKGLLKEIKASYEGEVYYLEVEAVSFSILADAAPVSRSFQDAGMDYSAIAGKLAGENGLSVDFAGPALSVNNLLLQYRETNWEFLKRIASHSNAVLLPKITEPGFYFGLPDGNSKGSLEAYRFYVGKRLDRYRKYQGAGVGLSADDAVEYTVTAENAVLSIGDTVDYGGSTLYVRRAEIRLKDAVLSCLYSLCTKKGLEVPVAYKADLTGLSLAAEVLEVAGDTVKVLLCVDESQDTAAAYAFPYITPYSVEGHTGLYLMPEKGDVVLIQFPTEDESLAVAASSYRQAETDRTGDPQVKYLRTSHDKEVRISEKEILITAKTGGLYVKLNEDDGVEIFTQHGIVVNTLSGIDVSAAGHISVSAGGSVMVNAGGGCSINAGGKIVERAGKDYSLTAGGASSVKTGKEMIFSAADKIGMETEKKLIVNSEDDMLFVSKKNLTLSSKEDMIQETDKKLKVSSKAEIGLSCKASSIKMDGAMNLKASQIKEN